MNYPSNLSISPNEVHMIMRAKSEGNVVIFELEGHLDFETTTKFEEAIGKAVEGIEKRKVIVNMDKLRFVGSSGINQFVQAIKNFNHHPNRPKLCKVSSEFTKIFKAYQTARHPFEFFETETQAILAFDIEPPPEDPSKRPARKKKSN